MLLINTEPTPTVLYTKISNSAPSFWGMTRNQINLLIKDKIRWYAVLLARDSYSGYIFTQEEVLSLIKDGTFELSGDGDYKVNENSDCSKASYFDDIS